MGCDIHSILEIKRDGKWEYIPELPEAFEDRHYNMFSLLCCAVRRGNFPGGFEPKGLPKDLSGRKFRFISDKHFVQKQYDNMANAEKLVCWIEAENKCISATSTALYQEITKEKYDEIVQGLDVSEEYKKRYYMPMKLGAYTVYDASKVGGILVKKIIREAFPTLREFNENYCYYKWCEEQQDFGDYDVDFDDTDLHNFSHLTLTELLTKVADIKGCDAFKVEKEFLNNLEMVLGEMPDEMIIEDIDETMSEVSFMLDEGIYYTQKLYNDAVEEIKQIKEKYGVDSDNDIRVVFAFDS